MARSVLPFAVLGLTLAAAGCGGAPPPAQLAGLWSVSPAACAAGVGVRFGPNVIEAVYLSQTETLFERPRYTLVDGGESMRIRVIYELPRLPGGVRSAGARGVFVLAGQADGRIAPVAHNLLDSRTGAVRLRVQNDPATALLTLVACDPVRQQLRGRV